MDNPLDWEYLLEKHNKLFDQLKECERERETLENALSAGNLFISLIPKRIKDANEIRRTAYQEYLNALAMLDKE